MKKTRREILVNLDFTPLVTALLVITFSSICGAPDARAQSAVAALSGVVMDQTGGVIPGATVRIMNPSTGFTREVTTNDAGIYSFPSLTPGNYTVTVRSGGFATVEIKDIVLNINDQRSLQIQLKVGGVGETVQVTAAPSLSDESPVVRTVVDRQFVENLPLAGRSFQSLIELVPGVTLTETSVSSQGQFSVNGQRASANSFYVDGVSANFGGSVGANLYQFAAGILPALSVQGSTNNLVSVDAVEEFSIQTSTYAPEFGRTPGAQISILTRSGTNAFHGSVFEYFGNDALDANDWFANSRNLPRAALRQNHFGGVLGGPLYLPRFGEGGPAFVSGKDRSFFFFSYEGQRLRLPQTRLTEVPSLAARQSATAAIRPLLDAYPLPNGPVTQRNPLLAEFNTSFSDPSSLNVYSLRLDHTVKSRLQLFGRYNGATSDSQQRAAVSDPTLGSILLQEPGLAASNVQAIDFRTRTLTLGGAWSISPRLNNDFRFNHSTHKILTTVAMDTFGGAIVPPASAFFTTPQPFDADNSVLALVVDGASHLNYFFGRSVDNLQRQLNLVDHLSLVAGSHSLKFGGDYRHLSPVFAPRDYVAAVQFASISQLLAGRPRVIAVQRSRGGGLFFNNVGVYAQDTWKVSSRLTLTYGLRLDLDLTPTLSEGLQPVSVTSAGFADPGKLALAPPGTPLWGTRYNNFAPRVGVAYKLREKVGLETMLRGGFGVFYDLASQQAGQLAQANYPPFGAQRGTSGVINRFPLTPTLAAPPSLEMNLSYFNVTLFNPELKAPYSLHWNLALEQSLGSHQTVTASYVAAVGRRLLQEEFISGPLNLTFASPILIDNTATSDYHALQLQYQRRLSRGLQALASYTWGHSIDTASTTGFSDTNSLTRGAPNANRGSSDFDIRQTFTTGIIYDIPAPFESAAARAILGGWSVDNIFRARSAPPATVIAASVHFPDSNAVIRPDLAPGVPLYLHGDQFPGGKALNPAAFKDPPVGPNGAPLRQGTLGRNALRGFGAHQWDFSLRRQFKLGEAVKLQFRSEFFNLFNHPNFGQPDNLFTTATPLSPTFGQATNMLGRSLAGGGLGGGVSPLHQIGGPRSIRFALKLVF